MEKTGRGGRREMTRVGKGEKKSFCISIIISMNTQQYILLYFRGRILNLALNLQLLLNELGGNSGVH